MALETPFGAGVLNVCFDFEFIFWAKNIVVGQLEVIRNTG